MPGINGVAVGGKVDVGLGVAVNVASCVALGVDEDAIDVAVADGIDGFVGVAVGNGADVPLGVGVEVSATGMG